MNNTLMPTLNPNTMSRVRLLVRLDARDFQNRQDYLMRLAEVNMLRGPADLVDVLGRSYAQLTRMEPVALNDLIAGATPAEKVPVNRNCQNEGLRTTARVCPVCLQLGEPVHPYVNFAVPTPCILHTVMPIDECPKCTKPLSYLRSQVRFCDCGFDLAKTPLSPPPKWFSRFIGRFAQWRREISLNPSYAELVANYNRTGLVVKVLTADYPNNLKTVSSYTWVKLRELLAMEKYVLCWESSFKEFVSNLEANATVAQQNAVYGVLKRSKSKSLIKEVEMLQRQKLKARKLFEASVREEARNAQGAAIGHPEGK